MLNKNKILHVLFLALIFSLGAVAQDAKTESNNEGYRQGGWWTLGINGGLSYQTSDVCNTYDGWGVGLTLAKNLYYKPGAPIAFDLRGRLLYANQKGQDWERSYGVENNVALNGTDDRDFFFQGPLNYLENPSSVEDSSYIANYRNDLGEIGLEAVFNLNRLKERTNVIVNLYGGINLDWYKTRIDQANDDGFPNGMEYDYSNISTTDKSTALTQIESTRDYTYETVADGFKNEYGTLAIMPSAGFELGYQLTPRFSIIGGHKVTWSLDDKMDGQRWNNDNTLSTNNDLYHYTHVGLRWIIDPHASTMEPPIIKIIRPNPLPHATQSAYATVKAEIENINSAADVNCTFNGNTFNAFAFNPRSEDFSCSLNLNPGRNEFIITATNMAGQDTENVVIIYNEPTTVPTPTRTPPVVKITRPNRPGTTVKNSAYTMTANVNHVTSRSDIKVFLNGSSISDFSYSFNSDKLEAALTLKPGKNTIKVVGTNKDGSDNDQTTIIYEQEEAPCPDPVVSINNITRPQATSNANIAKSNVTATVKNVKNRSDIKMYVNGDRTTDFSYNTSNGSLTAAISVGKGRNEIRIVATTDCGKDEDKENVTYNATTPTTPTPTPTTPTPPAPNPVQQPPIVDISTPNNGITTSNTKVNLVATVKHVTSKNNIRMTLNGVNYNNFSYNVNTKVLNANNIPIRVGTNTIEVKASNNVGTDSDDVLVIRENNTPTPPPAPTCPKPTVKIDNITTPAPTLMNPNKAKFTLFASTQNVSSKNQIKLYINGVITTNFNFSTSTGKMVANVEADKGTSNIKLVVTTNCGSDQDTDSVVFETTTPKPVVNIVKPSNNASYNVSNAQLSVTVLNVTSKSDITIKVNGSTMNNFTFNANSNSVLATVNLQEGNNSIVVTATNAAGSDSDSKSVKYIKPVVAQPKPPVVNITKPANGSTVKTTSATLKATVLNVTSKNNIKVKLNGVNVSNFTLSGTTVTAGLIIKEGTNKIEVIATNADGQDKGTVSVKYVKPLLKPTVKITKPTGTPTVKTAAFVLKATLTNIKAKKDVTVLLNGKKITAFTYNVRAGNLSAPLTLKVGKNTVVVKGQNPSGTASDSKTIIYKKDVVTPTANKPTVKIDNITTPAPTLMNPNIAKCTLFAITSGITRKDQIKVYVNGVEISTFNFDPARNKMVANIELPKGKSLLKVVVQSNGGKAEDEQDITF